MTTYNRPDELVMAESALAGEVQEFPDILRGWGITFEQTGGLPPMEWVNYIARRSDQAIRYFMQRGLPEWSPTEDYPQGAYVQYAGNAYLSKRANTNKQPGAGGSTNDWGRWSVTRDEFDAGTTGRILTIRSMSGAGLWTPTAGAKWLWARGWGGGGGGQASSGAAGGGGFGGGGGGYFEWFGPINSLGAGPSYAYTVGSGGGPGTTTSQTGASGGNTTLASTQLVANGGFGGGIGGSAGGAASTVPAGALIVVPGREGQGTIASPTNGIAIGGTGGNAFAGPGGSPHNGTGGSGVAGGGGAGGGSAGSTIWAGGSGGNGALILMELT